MAIKVLVVDDSALMRKHLTDLFSGAGFEVCIARHGKEAVSQVLAELPDVVTLDINMPEMDGLTALSLIMAARPTPVIMVSSLTEKGALATLEALAMGAVDYVAKPGGTISLSISSISADLVQKVRVASRAKLKSSPQLNRTAAAKPKVAVTTSPVAACGVVLIGVSTGGPRTLEEILPLLPADFPWPVIVAQHMPAAFTASFASRLNSLCALNVQKVASLQEIRPGQVYIGKGGGDITLTKRADRLYVQPKPESTSYLWHPSVDLLTESALEHLAPNALIGVLLTGMGDDGAKAMTQLKQHGGRTIAESEETAVVFGMPRELAARGGATLVLPAYKIATQLVSWLR